MKWFKIKSDFILNHQILKIVANDLRVNQYEIFVLFMILMAFCFYENQKAEILKGQ
jgi:hypothetical protein